jgi:hypothetical protein
MIVLLAPFAQLFSDRVWLHAQVLVVGAILVPGKRTVSSCLRVMGLAWEYHFTNYQYAIGEAFRFDPTKPTSLLYEKHGDDYKLIGAMYTAPVRFSEQQLNERIPLSMAQWHQHVNMCKPPKGREVEALRKDARFGLNGSIATQEACEAAGGTFMPHVFGWMVHMYPWEKTPDEIWSLERARGRPAQKPMNMATNLARRNRGTDFFVPAQEYLWF